MSRKARGRNRRVEGLGHGGCQGLSLAKATAFRPSGPVTTERRSSNLRTSLFPPIGETALSLLLSRPDNKADRGGTMSASAPKTVLSITDSRTGRTYEIQIRDEAI